MGPQGLLVVRLPAPLVPHSASLGPAKATGVLSTLVPVSAPPTSLDECLFSISLVLVPFAVQFSVSSGCVRRRSVSTYAAILVLRQQQFKNKGQPELTENQTVWKSDNQRDKEETFTDR